MRAFRTSDGRKAFFQWDTGQRLIIDSHISMCTQVHFCNGSSTQALVVDVKEENGERYCDVPNILLQEASPIRCYTYLYDGSGRTTHEGVFEVLPRRKPYDYVYTETECRTWDELDERLDNLESIDHATPISNEEIEDIMRGE